MPHSETLTTNKEPVSGRPEYGTKQPGDYRAGNGGLYQLVFSVSPNGSPVEESRILQDLRDCGFDDVEVRRRPSGTVWFIPDHTPDSGSPGYRKYVRAVGQRPYIDVYSVNRVRFRKDVIAYRERKFGVVPPALEH